MAKPELTGTPPAPPSPPKLGRGRRVLAWMREHWVELASLAVAAVVGFVLVSRAKGGGSGGPLSVPSLGGGGGAPAGGTPGKKPRWPKVPIPRPHPPEPPPFHAQAFAAFGDWLAQATSGRADLLGAISSGRWADVLGEYNKELADYDAAHPGAANPGDARGILTYAEWVSQSGRPDITQALAEGRLADLFAEYVKEAWATLVSARGAGATPSPPVPPAPRTGGTLPKRGLIGHPSTLPRHASPPPRVRLKGLSR